MRRTANNDKKEPVVKGLESIDNKVLMDFEYFSSN